VTASIEGSVCVVTGASSGIGRALALALASAGTQVWAIGRSSERLDSLAHEAGRGGSVIPLVVDLEHDDDLEAAARDLLSANERVDVLVHSAGVIELGTLESASSVGLDRHYALNLRAPFRLTQALLPALKRARGQIVFINSSAALRASSNNVLYAATKAGLKALADGLRDEVNRDGVRVVTIYAGRTATPMQASVHDFEGRPYKPELLMQPEDIAQVTLATLMLPGTAEVTDISMRPAVKPADAR
jgi:NADP-dependent 3-hydroxy acid dehydrogenase YdfG